MNFKEHWNLKGKHALFSPSQPAFLRYDDEKILLRYLNKNRVQLGTEIHEFAASQIELHIKATSVKNLASCMETYIYSKYSQKNEDYKQLGLSLINSLRQLPKEVFETVKLYINDGIGYRMTPEQILYYSDDIFGTADTISFREDRLRIHDLKTGVNPAHMEQLILYAALFCLEYSINPLSIRIELRLYQDGNVICHEPETAEIQAIIDKLIFINKNISKLKEE